MVSSSMSSCPGEDLRALCVGIFAVFSKQEAEIQLILFHSVFFCQTILSWLLFFNF